MMVFLRILPLTAVLSGFAGTALAAQDTIALEPTQASLLGITASTAQPAQAIALEHLPATLEAALEHSTAITSPYPGTVSRVLVLEGEDVAAGTPLAWVQSREYLALETAATRAASETKLAKAQAERDAALLSEGIIPAARAEASKAQYAQAAATQAEAQRALLLAPRARAGAPGEYELRAPMAGRVLERRITPGQALEALETAFVVADASRVDAVIRVPVSAREQLRPGLVVSLAGSDLTGHLVAVGHAVDPGSQTLVARARFEQARSLVPGENTTVTIQLPAPADSLALPRMAVIRQGNDSVAFVVEAGGYRPVSVEVLGQSRDSVIVRGELSAGESVAATGTSALKALLNTDE